MALEVELEGILAMVQQVPEQSPSGRKALKVHKDQLQSPVNHGQATPVLAKTKADKQ